jgi:hypothetical protein
MQKRSIRLTNHLTRLKLPYLNKIKSIKNKTIQKR